MLSSLLFILYLLTAFVAVAAWTIGMYLWWQLNYSSKPGVAQLRRRVVGSFAATVAFGVAAWSLHLLQSTGG
ncbi:hypothetical protein EEB15_28430 [Ramlibacter sp. WS9]|nr:hypothetical protein EEB15_28430 [Ramlibacter sp. WS9]